MDPESKLDRYISRLHDNLIEHTKSLFGRDSVPSSLENAFHRTPRHRFVHRFQCQDTGDWIELTPDNLHKYVDTIYQDRPISTYRNQAGELASTISQPSLVLFMIHLLDLQAGQHVFELGGGSGWHSALMARMVGPDGSVDSLEIIEDLVGPAQESARDLGIENLYCHHGDGAKGYTERAPFDCGVFTAASPELPQVFFDQIKYGGLLEFVFKLPNQHDILALLRRTERGFTSELLMPCSFVPVTGSQTCPSHDFVVLEKNQIWQEHQSTEPTECYWYELDIHSSEVEAFLHFCNNTMNGFTHFDSFENEHLRSSSFLCGLIDDARHALLLLNESTLLSYGNSDLVAHVKRHAQEWVDSGKPEIDDLRLEILPVGTAIVEDSEAFQWIYKTDRNLYCWSPYKDE